MEGEEKHNEDDENQNEDRILDHIFTLASSRPDVWPVQKRKDVMEEVNDALKSLSTLRKTLATWNELSCTSRHAYHRLVPMYIIAIGSITIEVEGADDEVSRGLVRNLCRLLEVSKNLKLVNECGTQLKALLSPSKNPVVVDTLYSIAKDNRKLFAIAVSLGYGLDGTKDWRQVFLQQSISSSILATADEISCLKPFLLEAFFADKASLQESLWDPLLRKCKANPEQGLGTLLGLVKIGVEYPWNSQPEFMTMLVSKQHLLSTKDVPRDYAAEILTLSAKDNKGGLGSLVLPTLADVKITTATQRKTMYLVWNDLAQQLLRQPQGLSSKNLEMSSLTKVCKALIAFLSKETASMKEAGLLALWKWLYIVKIIEMENQIDASNAKDPILTLLRKPIVDKNRSEMVVLFGTLLRTIPQGPYLDSLVADLWKGDKKKVEALEKGLDVLSTPPGSSPATATASKKQSSIAPVEGLLAVYLGLVYVTNTSTQQHKVPSYLSKALKAPFLFGPSMRDAASTSASAVQQSMVGLVLPRVVAMVARLATIGKEVTFPQKPAIKALASCITHPQGDGAATATAVITELTETVLAHQGSILSDLISILFQKVNETAMAYEETVMAQNATREAREKETDAMMTVFKGQTSANSSHYGMDVNAVRNVACHQLAPKCSHDTSAATMAQALVLMHAGSSLRQEGHQRKFLLLNTLQLLQKAVVDRSDQEEFISSLASEIVVLAAEPCLPEVGEDSKEKGAKTISIAVHRAALSVLESLGGTAVEFLIKEDELHYLEGDGEEEKNEVDPSDKAYEIASILCIKQIAPKLARLMMNAIEKVDGLKDNEIDLYLSPSDVPFGEETETDATAEKSSGVKQAKGKKKGGASLEDEEWERQLKKEIAEKKKKEASASSTTVKVALTPAQQKLVSQQNVERQRVGLILTGEYSRCLRAIRYLSLSDIEVGNACLPVVSKSVTTAAALKCSAFRAIRSLHDEAVETLKTLAGCVYEIAEEFAPSIAQALMISCTSKNQEKVAIENAESTTKDAGTKPKEDADYNLLVSALPARCSPAAAAISEMDEFHGALSGNSFVLLFPLIQAALLGPRTTGGCEGALRVLMRHTSLLAGPEMDVAVAPLRKDMIISVLELLRHDRAQTFQDPTPNDTLVACCQTGEDDDVESKAMSTTELAPLLNERGALGGNSCRVGSMLSLGQIASRHRRLIKNNPLIENRIWLNCFARQSEIRVEARRTWRILHGEDAADIEEDGSSDLKAPSMLYSPPLLPLLNHADKSIALAAADANACAMGMHPKTIHRNIQKLCTTYIEAYPAKEEASSKAPSLLTPLKTPTPVPQPKKPSIVLPKKKTGSKKSALGIAGIGRPKTTKKKTSSHAALLKPKQERTLDQEALASQFISSDKQKPSVSKDSPAKIGVRLGILQAVTAMTNSKVEMGLDTLKMLTSFLMAFGIADVDESVKNSARNALRDVVASNGSSDEAIAFLLPHLEEVLKTGVANVGALGPLPADNVPKDVAASDTRKEGAVVALGSVALHLKGPENEGKIDSTVDMLLAALKTPSEDVQASVAGCLVKLMKKGRTQQRIESILDDLMQQCLHGEKLATRRGAAYGISAAVKGSGIATLKKFEIVKKLEEACSTGSPSSKEGSVFAMELLSVRLGLLFEPYVIVLLPSLLKAFSDSSDHVRQAAANTSSIIMSKLSAHGVKLVMPAVLTAFNDAAWRTKQASIRLLGAMSHLAPKQLASALPKVVPKLIDAFGDTHPKVKASAQEALDEISTVIRNPEVSSISPVLLKALTDPADNTIKALEALIETEFLHAIDAPSLALIVPILHRGLRDRGATTKRFGALIAGNICSMINDSRDFVPYLPTLLPDLKSSLLDPIPDVRSTSAKALGSLTRGLGESLLPDLAPWLIVQLGDESCSSAERSGAAQGLTEVLVAGGSSMVEDTVRNQIMPLKDHPEASKREGVLWMLTFLPPTLGQGFTPLMDVALPALIGGLSDDSEPVRDVAMRAGRVLIKSHGKVHVDKILPSLEAGLSNEDYRIRLASLTLLGDLLSTIGGTTVLAGDASREDMRKAERAQAQIALTLGNDRRNSVLSELYLARSDTSSIVRSSAVQVWKTVVSVTGRVLREILPVLVERVIAGLASGDAERTLVAGRCLGEVVSKLGESVLAEIIPVLRKTLYNGDNHTKRGVCVGLAEVIKCSAKEQIVRYIEIIVKLVQDALCDEDEKVRDMAAASFQSLYAVVGSQALEEVLPALMVALENSDGDEVAQTRALNGLTGIMRVRSRDLLPYVIPKLLRKPVSTNHAEAIAAIAHVTGDSLHYQYNSIIPTLLMELASPFDEDEKEREGALRDAVRSVCANAQELGMNWLVSEIASKCGSDKAALRRECCWMFEMLITERKDETDFYEHIPIMLRELLNRLNDSVPEVLKADRGALAAMSKHVPAEELVKHIEFIRNLIASIVSESRRKKGGVGDGQFLMPGFNMPKGLEPLLPIYQRGILYGNASIREVSAAGLGEVIDLTANKFLAGPVIVKMTGPLLRVVGDRNPSNVKIAILRTLGLILVKGGPALRAFVPQFQTTFVKALSDPSRQVRIEAVKALSLLMPLSTRVDPLIKELVAGALGKSSSAAETGPVVAIQTATLEALAVVLHHGGKKAKLAESVPSALNASKELLWNGDEGVREGAAKVMGVAVEFLGVETADEVLGTEILASDDGINDELQHGRGCAVRRIFSSSIGSELNAELNEKAIQFVTSLIESNGKNFVREAGFVAVGAVVARATDPKAALRRVGPALLAIMEENRLAQLDTHVAIARGLCVLLKLVDATSRIDLLGKAFLDASLQLAMSGAQKVQFAYNDVLWLALDVSSGQAGLERYNEMAYLDKQRAMKSIHSKVLSRIKEVTLIED